MKPAPFVRHVPKTLEEVLKILAEVRRRRAAFCQGAEANRASVATHPGSSNDDARYWHKAGIRQCPLSGVKRTWHFAAQMSAFDPKRTSRVVP
jgi:hypothetical protein